MIITRAPLRISFVGGGTDFEDYSRIHGGFVVSTTIDKYVYVTVNRKFDGRIHVRYSDIECVDRLDDLRHNICREALRMTGVDRAVEIAIVSDVPSQGSGLGSSSSLAVGLLKALYIHIGYAISPRELAERACELEIGTLQAPIGRQDQCAAAHGGFNMIKFAPSGEISVRGLGQYEEKAGWLEKATLLFYLNGRSSNAILSSHKSAIPEKGETLDRQALLVQFFLVWLQHSAPKHEVAGQLISRSWELKKAMTPAATNDRIDSLVAAAMDAGALGAKVCGAGGGGFLMILCEPEHQDAVRQALPLREMRFKFEKGGAKAIYEQ